MSHKRGAKTGEFCTAPGSSKCLCGNDYRAVCKKIENKEWANFTTMEKQKGKRRRRAKNPFEAHHILCVSCVMKELQTKVGIITVVRQAKWCINKGNNMIALPLWGHTVKWYCDPDESSTKAPPFADRPQHDFDHNKKDGYTHEVSIAVRKMANTIKAQGHNADPDKIVKALNKASSDFRKKLRERGERSEGTHEGWKKGTKGLPNWYMPFSMASAAEVRKFPVRNFNEEKKAWIVRLKDAMWGR